MKKEEYEKYIDPAEVNKIYENWAAEGKPTNNDKNYTLLWEYAIEASKACIGSIQRRYKCLVIQYDEKVLDTAIKVMKRLCKMEAPLKNIVSVAYLPALGTCFESKARQQDFEEEMSLLDFTGEDFVEDYQDLTYCSDYITL